MTEIKYTITKKQIRDTVIKYIEDNQKRPKNEQTAAYKELEQLLKEKGIPIEEMSEIILYGFGMEDGEKSTIKEKEPYSSWDEREKAEDKMLIKQVLVENEMTYEEVNKKCAELENEYSELTERVEEIRLEALSLGHLRTILLVLEMVGYND